MKNCGQRQENLKAYLDGELPVTERLAIWWHLLRCEKCREARMAMTEISRRLTDGDPGTLDPALRARILSSVTYTDKPESRAATPNYRRPGYPILLLGGATAAALLVIVVMTSPHGSDSPLATMEQTKASKSAAPPAPAATQSSTGVASPADKTAAGEPERQNDYKRPSAVQSMPPGAADESQAQGFAQPRSEAAAAKQSIAPASPALTEQHRKDSQYYRVSDDAQRKPQYFNSLPSPQQLSGGTLKMDAALKNASGGRAQSAPSQSASRKAARQSQAKVRALRSEARSKSKMQGSLPSAKPK